jgi:hypothetical protein
MAGRRAGCASTGCQPAPRDEARGGVAGSQYRSTCSAANMCIRLLGGQYLQGRHAFPMVRPNLWHFTANFYDDGPSGLWCVSGFHKVGIELAKVLSERGLVPEISLQPVGVSFGVCPGHANGFPSCNDAVYSPHVLGCICMGRLSVAYHIRLYIGQAWDSKTGI